MLIGISGKARSGKDTLGQYICDEYKCLHYYFAKPLKEGARVMFGLTDEQVENKETVVDLWGMSPRKIYQLLGTEVGRGLDKQIWIKNAEMFVKSVPGRTVVITDVRFKNEAEWIRSRDGVVIHIERDSQSDITENTHSSENDIGPDDYDLLIKNNGTIADLCIEFTYHIQAGVV